MSRWLLHHKALATRLRSLASPNQSPASASPDDPCVIQAYFQASFLAYGSPEREEVAPVGQPLVPLACASPC